MAPSRKSSGISGVWIRYISASRSIIHSMRRCPSISSSSRVVSRTVSSGWIRSRLEQLDGLLREDALRARLEILKQLDGDLTIRPLPSEAGAAGHAFEIAGRIKRDGLLAMNQEAGCATLVAGAQYYLSANSSLEFRFEITA